MDFSWTTIVIVILLIIIVYFVWTMLSSSTTVSSVTQLATTPSTLTVADANSFSFSVWIYVNNWTTTGSNNKPIISTTAGSDFDLSLGNSNNSLSVKVGSDTLSVPNIPLQTWALIIENVNNGNSLDIYVNGKLVQTTALQSTYSLKGGSVTVGGSDSFDGYIYATFKDSPLGPQDAWDIYSNGYGSSGAGSSVSDFFNKYKVRFAFVKDNVELSSLDI